MAISRRAIFVTAAVVALAAVTAGLSPPLPTPVTYPSRCMFVGLPERPDHRCTPGLRSRVVTQSTIHQTICVVGWTATVRPPLAYTNRVKALAYAAYGLPVGAVSELDHLIPLELGGAPSDVRNLWPEPGKVPNSKDGVENALRQRVCSGKMTLAAAQKAIVANWTTAVP